MGGKHFHLTPTQRTAMLKALRAKWHQTIKRIPESNHKTFKLQRGDEISCFRMSLDDNNVAILCFSTDEEKFVIDVERGELIEYDAPPIYVEILGPRFINGKMDRRLSYVYSIFIPEDQWLTDIDMVGIERESLGETIYYAPLE